MRTIRGLPPKLDRAPLTSDSDVFPLELLVTALCGWLRHEQNR
jgi:hypothetical protein